MKRISIFLVVLLTMSGCEAATKEAPTQQTEHYLLERGGVFEPESYIEVSGVTILYDGDFTFTATNNSDDAYAIVPFIVGVKKDGTHELLQSLSFGGVDNEQYEKDMSDNGWAVPQWTNVIGPEESISCQITVFDFGEDLPEPDIDGDGYYDLIFTTVKQSDEFSVDNAESAVYRLPVEG